MKISIITVTYNSEKTIEYTIKSVLSQDFQDIEYLIIDGKSNDNTTNIIKQYALKYPHKIKWISEKDHGIYDAMNKGIKMSTGDIIGILNSDDFFTSNDIISKIVDTFLKHPSIEAVYGDIHFVKPENLNKCIRYYSSKIFSRPLMRFGFMPAHPSFYMKKDSFKKYGLYKTNYKIAADFEFLLRVIFLYKASILYLPVDMVTMRTGGVSTSGINARKQIMKEQLSAFKENDIYTNTIFLSLRYIYKIAEILFTKIKK